MIRQTQKQPFTEEVVNILGCIHGSLLHAPASNHVSETEIFTDMYRVTLLLGGFSRQLFDNYFLHGNLIPNVIQDLICSILVVSGIIERIDGELTRSLRNQMYVVAFLKADDCRKFEIELHTILKKSIIKWYFSNKVYNTINNTKSTSNSHKIAFLKKNYYHQINSIVFKRLIQPQLDKIYMYNDDVHLESYNINSIALETTGKINVVCATKYHYVASIHCTDKGGKIKVKLIMNISHWQNWCDITETQSWKQNLDVLIGNNCHNIDTLYVSALQYFRYKTPAFVALTSTAVEQAEHVNLAQLGCFILNKMSDNNNQSLNDLLKKHNSCNTVEQSKICGILTDIAALCHCDQLQIAGIKYNQPLFKHQIKRRLGNFLEWIAKNKMVGQYETIRKDQFADLFSKWLIEFQPKLL